jgi:Flp pilus assembly protein CpaB
MLRPGMLAFQIPLQRRSTAVDLLYPGCIVDVFATFPLTNSDKGEAVVTPLLQNIQVLAIEDETVVPQESEGGSVAPTPRRQPSMSGSATVTLEVNSRQAAALQLALERGTLGLAMRNPLDKEWNPMEPMVVKEGQLTAGSEALDPATLALFGSLQRMLIGGTTTPDANSVAPTSTVASSDPNAPVPVLPIVAPAPVPGLEPKAPARQVTVIKGSKVEDVEVKEEQQGQDAELEPQEGDV